MSSTSTTGAAKAGARHAAGARAATRLLRRRTAWIVGTAAATAGLFVCYLLQSRTIASGPDGSSIALQAWDMMHGNPLLRGWWVADVTFYTTELPQYMLIESFRGLSADVLHIGGAMTYTLLVLLAGVLARGRARGSAGVVRALLAAGIMLAPQLGHGTQTLLLSPDHFGTAVPVLLVLALIDLAGRRWFVPPLVGLVLAWVVVADELVIVIGAVPLALVCGERVFRGAVLRREGLRAQWYELSLAVAAIAAIPAGFAGIALIRMAGGWQSTALQPKLVPAGMLARTLRLTGEGLLNLFGADFADTGSARGVVFAMAHLVGVALVVWGCCAAVRRFFRRDAMVESVLVTAIAVNLVAFVATVPAVNILSAREFSPVLPFAAVLAGRLAGERLLALRAGPILGVVLAGYLAMLGYGAAQPARAPAYSDLTAWLSAHHLTSGVSAYSEANAVTAQSGGRISVRPVAVQGRYLAPRHWEATRSWYDPGSHQGNFVVLSPSMASQVPVRAVVATFGPPSRTYRYREYTIMVWRENLFGHLH